MDAASSDSVRGEQMTNDQFIRMAEIAASLRDWPDGKPLYSIICERLLVDRSTAMIVRNIQEKA